MSPVAGITILMLRFTLSITMPSFLRRWFDKRPKNEKAAGTPTAFGQLWTIDRGSTIPTARLATKKAVGASAPTASEISDEKRSYRSPGALAQSTIALQGMFDLYAMRLNLLVGCDVYIILNMMNLSIRHFCRSTPRV
jgi:hypothetical protein